MATARAAWGIDIGNRALKAVKVVKEADGVRITDFAVVEHENVLSNAGDNREALIQSALAIFTQTHNLKGEPVAVGVSGQSSFARFIKLPPVEDKQIPNIVRFEAIQQIPFPLEDVEWSYHLFRDENSPDVEVGIFAMRKELVQQHIRFFTDAGLNVQVVQMNPLAVYNAMYHDERLKGTTMVIDLGAENTDLIISEGETVWLRSIPIGGNNFTESLVKSFKLRFEKAEELKRNAATSKYGRQILQAMRPIFADLVAEIQRSIGFYASVHRDSRITKVIALGGTFALPGLQKYLQQNLQLDVQKIDRLGNAPPADTKLATALSENILSAASPYGLALQAIGEAKIESSLLPQAIRREREWRGKTKWFAAAAACVVAGTGLSVGSLYLAQAQYNQADAVAKRTALASELDRANRMVTEWSKVETAGADEKKQIANLDAMKKYRELWEGIYSDIITSVPPAQPGQDKLPRAQRKEVVVDQMDSSYLEDMTSVLAMNDADILDFVNQQDTSGRSSFVIPGISPTATPAIAPGAPGPAGPYGFGMRLGVPMPGYPYPVPGRPYGYPGYPGGYPGAPGAAPSTPAVASTPGAQPRGFVVKLHCMTPYGAGKERGLELITQTLVQRLKEKMNHPTTTPPSPIDVVTAAPGSPTPTATAEYRIEKVWVPRYVKLSDDPARVEQLRARAREAAQRRQASQAALGAAAAGPSGAPAAPAAPGEGGAVPGRTGVFGRPGYPANIYGRGPALAPGAAGTANGAPTDELVDPQHPDETIVNDGDAFVVAAIVLDPKLDKPPAGAATPTTAPGATPAATPAATPGTTPAAPAATPAAPAPAARALVPPAATPAPSAPAASPPASPVRTGSATAPAPAASAPPGPAAAPGRPVAEQSPPRPRP